MTKPADENTRDADREDRASSHARNDSRAYPGLSGSPTAPMFRDGPATEPPSSLWDRLKEILGRSQR